MSSNIEESYAELVMALRRLGVALGPANAAQYEPAPRVARAIEEEVRRQAGIFSDPTTTIALDDRRLALRRMICDTDHELRSMVVTLTNRAHQLRAVMDDWEEAP